MNEAIRMQLSAFVDGELPENEEALLLRRMSQDAALRQQVAEYLAIGRAMRGEAQYGFDNDVRERIAAALGSMQADETADVEGVQTAAEPAGKTWLRPLAGLAIAASVALVAIIGLQQFGVTPELDAADTTQADRAFPTQPAADEVLERYRIIHDTSASDSDRINAVLADFEMRTDADDDAEDEARESSSDSAEPVDSDSAEVNGE